MLDPMRAWHEGHYPEDHDVPDPDEIGPTPRWFVIAFSIAVLCCGVASCMGAISYIAGWWS